jgi:hypothetical protein
VLLLRHAADKSPDPRGSAPVEGASEYQQAAVDDAPGDVAADRRDQQFPRGVAAVADDEAGRQREGERHDEAEQQFAQALPGTQVSRDEIDAETRHDRLLRARV